MSAAAPRRPLRLWPGVAIAALMLLFRLVVPTIAPEATIFGMPALYFGVFAGMLGGVAVVLWWLFLSRAPWSERLGAVILMPVALFVARPLLDKSIATGAMGRLFPVLAIPVLSIAFVVWAVATHRLADGLRRVSMVVTILLACAGWALVRTGGFTGGFDHDLAWRWSDTPEERLLARADDEPAPIPSAPPSPPPSTLPSAAPAAAPEPPKPKGREKEADWPGFRGPGRDGIVRGPRIETDWSASPPAEMWRRSIGPGWSSFAVQGDLLYTQEQRGDDEVVAAYKVTTGEPVWRHRDATRFWESNGGAGPRGTPTLGNGRVYALGATGIMNTLDARSGAVVWTRNAASDTKTEVPDYGFASSPLVAGDVVIVATAGTLVAYDVTSGDLRWVGPNGRSDYSSPQLATIHGVEQVLLLNGGGTTSVLPADGTVLWEHALPPNTRIVQPALTPDGDVLMSDGAFGEGNALRRIAVTRSAANWTSEERWRSTGLKPTFNDYVLHEGHAYGFDGSILACIDLADGQRKWKGGRYGNGQLVLLPDQDVLLVLSEEGELALVAAAPDRFTELGRVPAIQGKTWNHPVLVGDVLLVRNGEEMAAFRLRLTE